MGPCIVNVNIFKHNQQDATLHNDIYYYKWFANANQSQLTHASGKKQ
jgi:hypothetical protein